MPLRVSSRTSRTKEKDRRVKDESVIALHDPALWPVRMTRRGSISRPAALAAHVVLAHRDRAVSAAGRRWALAREVVTKYVTGGIKEFEKRAARKHAASKKRPAAAATANGPKRNNGFSVTREVQHQSQQSSRERHTESGIALVRSGTANSGPFATTTKRRRKTSMSARSSRSSCSISWVPCAAGTMRARAASTPTRSKTRARKS